MFRMRFGSIEMRTGIYRPQAQRFLQTANPFVIDVETTPFQFGGQTGNWRKMECRKKYP